jgi:hypothetical protein
VQNTSPPMLSHHNHAFDEHGICNSSIALYSALVLDLDTIFCFLAHHDIKFGPRKTANPPVDFLSSMHPA